MKNNKTTLILIGFLLIACVAIGFLWADSKASKNMVQMVEDVNREKIAGLEAQMAAKDQQIFGLEKEVKEFLEQLQGLRDELIDIRKDNEEMKEKLKDAPPEHLVNEAKRIVETDEIWLAGTEVKFSLAAFRDNTIILSEWENWKLKLHPNLYATIDTQRKTINTQAAEIVLWKEKEQIWEDHLDTMERINEAWKDYIKKQQRKGFFDTVLKIGAGVGVGFLIGSILSN
jgi:hypothetical protein